MRLAQFDGIADLGEGDKRDEPGDAWETLKVLTCGPGPDTLMIAEDCVKTNGGSCWHGSP